MGRFYKYIFYSYRSHQNICDITVEVYSEPCQTSEIECCAKVVNAESRYPTNICWSSRRLEDVLKTCLEDVFNTSSA